MSKASITHYFWISILLILVVFSCLLIRSPGTLDMHTWARWLQDYLDYGPLNGYSHNKTDYPPLMVFIFYLFAKFSALLGAETFVAIKVAILFFLLTSTLLVFNWTRSYALTAFFYFVFILNTMALGYADIILSYFLIFSFWQLKNKRVLLSACAFSLAIFIKWQALIILPFLFIYALSIIGGTEKNIIKITKQTVLPFVVVGGLIIYAFGLNPVWAAFIWAFDHPWLSGYALNIHWVLTFIYQTFYPELFGGLRNGEITYIATANPPMVFILCKAVAILTFFYTLLIFYRSVKNMETLLVFSLSGYLMYFTFNTGVHENHLFLAMVLSILLAAENRKYLSCAIYIATAFNLNMFFFYGFNGHSGPPRVIGGVFDITLILAFINTVFFTRLWFLWIASKPYPRAIGVV